MRAPSWGKRLAGRVVRTAWRGLFPGRPRLPRGVSGWLGGRSCLVGDCSPVGTGSLVGPVAGWEWKLPGGGCSPVGTGSLVGSVGWLGGGRTARAGVRRSCLRVSPGGLGLINVNLLGRGYFRFAARSPGAAGLGGGTLSIASVGRDLGPGLLIGPYILGCHGVKTVASQVLYAAQPWSYGPGRRWGSNNGQPHMSIGFQAG